MVVPQGMSYAAGIAHLPQEFGLYNAFIPALAYAAFGQSRQLQVIRYVVYTVVWGAGFLYNVAAAAAVAMTEAKSPR
jgi:MFS superfamily sulfate permease-like transporter